MRYLISKKYLLSLSILVFLGSFSMFGQYTITGTTSVNSGSTYTYTLNPSSNVQYTSWSAVNGTVSGMGMTSKNIQWSSTGSGSIAVTGVDYLYNSISASLNVTITGSAPSTPPSPTVQSSSCGQVILARAAPPSGVTYYWQSSSSGTITTYSSSTFARASGSVYYLRAKNSSGTWSSSSSSVSYTVPAAPIWYADTDLDGFGDPNSSLSQCTQPDGYVSDNSDACPTEYDLFDGCPSGSGNTTTYTSDFEAGLGDWTQDSDEDFDWTRLTGSTGSSGTGPTAANKGSYYIYTEASGSNNPSKTATITSTSYDLDSNGTITFDYHMYGATMGQLILSAKTPGGSWQVIWFLQGDQGNLWKTAEVDVSSYSTVSFRFTGVTGSSYTGDMSIDNIQITSSQQGCSSSLSDENYVHTVIPRKPTNDVCELNDDEKMESVSYFDGLGRPMQSVGIRSGALEQDIVTYIDYDDFGRQDKDYLPISVESNNGMYTPIDTDSIIKSYYDAKFPNEWTSESNANPYSEKEFEDSPISRVLSQGAPGEDWKITNHPVDFEYQTNSTSEVRKYEVSVSFANQIYTPTLILDTSSGNDYGYYHADQLHKSITYDENYISGTNHTTEEFKNKQGRAILKRNYNNGTHDTYYVYDEFGNLTYVLPPLTEPHDGIPSSTELSELCYQYKYDTRNRLVEKKNPGKGWEHILYNKIDQTIITQDQVQRDKSTPEWLYTKYDAFGRVVYTGLKQYNKTNTQYQSEIDGSSSPTFETRSSSRSIIAGDSIYYGSVANPTTFDKIYTINYYDSYIPVQDLAGGTDPITVYNVSTSSNVKGLPTVSKVKVLGTSSWITTVSYYDDKGREIYVYSNNSYLGTTDIVASKLDFVGNVVESTTTHKKTGETDIEIIDKFSYDHVGRLLTQTQNINDQGEELIVLNEYDELGQLKSKKVGGEVATIIENSIGLQTVDYNYNIRGWLKQINDVTSLGNDLFAFNINYNDGTGTDLFNGNISQTHWKTANTDSNLKTYSYGYDALDRITSAVDNTGNYNLVSVGYDKNGNITGLNRKGHTNAGATSFGTMDNLVYTYETTSNQLKKVLDNGNDTYGFKDGANLTTEYVYDTNGNMTEDKNKGITNISYNHLNLPTLINFGASNKIEYFYDATGIKQKKIVTDTGNTTTKDYAGNYVYENSALQFAFTREGYAEKSGTTFDYVYQYKDHLGNIRLSYSDSDGNGAIVSSEIVEENNYYPFGLRHKGYNNVVNGTHHSYTFGGKEEQEELGLDWHDFGARNYDASLGRWMNLDPLAEQMRRHSPYNYAFNNPIYFIDPDGRMPIGRQNMHERPEWWNDSKSSSKDNNSEQENTGPGDEEKVYKGSETVIGENVSNELDEVVLKAPIFTKKEKDAIDTGLVLGSLAIANFEYSLKEFSRILGSVPKEIVNLKFGLSTLGTFTAGASALLEKNRYDNGDIGKGRLYYRWVGIGASWAVGGLHGIPVQMAFKFGESYYDGVNYDRKLNKEAVDSNFSINQNGNIELNSQNWTIESFEHSFGGSN